MNNASKTILLVEDEAITAKLGVKTLQKYGYDVIHADTGEKAIEIVESIPGIDLKEAEEEILRINSAKSLFLAKMSHEIRTPLSSITGMIDLVLMTDDDMERLDYLTTIKQSSSHLISIVNDLLDFSKIESGALHLESVPFNPVREIKNSISIFLRTCLEKDIYLNFHSDEVSDLYIVSGDPTRFRQILINLIGNAVKFTETGGIDVKSQYLHEERTGNSKGITIVVKISDTGPGIAEDKQDIIFDNYVQSNPNIAGNYGGTGLGLAISRELVEMVGGLIDVESEPGKGSIFTVTIPFKLTDNNYNSGSIADDDSNNRSKNITYSVLVAEDDRISLKMITILLGKYGHNVVPASNGKEVIELLSKHKVDAILLDIEMPVMDGLETAARIRNGESGKEKVSIPIIALTAHNSSQIGEKCKSAGIDEVLSKPFKIEHFTPFIADLIELKNNK
jgi:signal transduction histidine kinase